MPASGRNILIHLAPLTPLADEIGKMAETGRMIPYPIPDGQYPLDRVVSEVQWHLMTTAAARGDANTTWKLYKALRERYPSSHRLSGIRLHLARSVGQEGMPPAENQGNQHRADAPAAERIDHLYARIRQKLEANPSVHS